MVSAKTVRKANCAGLLTTEMVVALAIISLAVFPLAFSMSQEQKYFRACYHRAVAVEIVDGEMEVLLAGEWKSFKDGKQGLSVVPGHLCGTFDDVITQQSTDRNKAHIHHFQPRRKRLEIRCRPHARAVSQKMMRRVWSQ